MNNSHKRHINNAIGALLKRAILALVFFSSLVGANAQPGPPTNCPEICVPIAIRRLSPNPIKSTNPSGDPGTLPLPVPAFGQANGYVPYFSTIAISAVGLPDGGVIEYSTDGGTTWASGQQVSIEKETTFLARTRQNDRVSTTVQGHFAPYYRRVFVLGNSITAISAVPSIGWFGNWGMAASSADKDYLHILTTRLSERNPDVKVMPIAGSSFERTWWTYDMASSLDEHLQFAPDQQGPDLIIVRIGENMDEGMVQEKALETYYAQLLDHLKKFSTGPVKIVVTTTFWQGLDQVNAVFRKVAADKGYLVADLHFLADNPAYRASQYTDPGLASHPNDAGMLQIADLIWAQIK